MADAGKVMIFPRGNYDATSVYEVLDLVNHNGASWVSKKNAINGIEPSEANSEYWFKMAGHIVVNNLTTSAEGYVLDARQGKLLQDALAVERARINQFTKLAEGSTTGDAELMDARVGADGVTYENLGEANRTQFANLKSDLSDLGAGYHVVSANEISQGTYSSTTSVDENTKRLRNKKEFTVNKGDTLAVTLGANCSAYSVGYFGADKNLIKEVGYISENRVFEFDATYLIVVVFKNTNEIELTPSEYDATLVFTKYNHIVLDDLFKFGSAMPLITPLENGTDLKWCTGYVSGGGIIAYDVANICSPQFIHVKNGTRITANNGYKINCCFYSEPKKDSVLEYSGFKTEQLINYDCFVRISLVSPTIEPMEIFPEAVQNITFESGKCHTLNNEIYSMVAKAEANHSAMLRFIKAMNDKAEEIGMTNSVFADVAGYDTATNRVTARDLVRLGVESCAYPILCRTWNKNTYTFTTLDKNQREIICEYSDDITPLTNYYTVLGKKPGYMPLSDGGSTFAMVAVCVVEDNIVVGAFGGATSRENRPKAMKQLMDMSRDIIKNGTTSIVPNLFTYGCSAILPKGNTASYANMDLNWIVEYNADTQFVPASTTKLLTALTLLDYVTDIHDKVTVLETDGLDYGSGQLFQNGDVLNYEQALHAIMLPSSGPCCRTVARTVGQLMQLKYD